MKYPIFATVIAPDIYTDVANGAAINLTGVHVGDEEILLHIGAIANVDKAFLVIEESHNGSSLWTQINQFSVLAANSIRILKVNRKEGYIRGRLAIEFVQPDPMNPVVSSLALSAILQRDR